MVPCHYLILLILAIHMGDLFHRLKSSVHLHCELSYSLQFQRAQVTWEERLLKGLSTADAESYTLEPLQVSEHVCQHVCQHVLMGCGMLAEG